MSVSFKIYKLFLFQLVIGVLTISLLSAIVSGQEIERLVIVGHVIGVEQPEMGWPREFERVKSFYVQIEKVLKGKSPAKYIRIAYGYNPSSSPENVLPKEMFIGKTKWKFDLSERSMFDGEVIVSKTEG